MNVSYLVGGRKGNIIFDAPEERIKFIPLGPIPPNPAELVNSQLMKKLVEKMPILGQPPRRLSENMNFVQNRGIFKKQAQPYV